MAVSGVSSSRSIYGNRNVLTGLVSGMDTESMIENAISAYKNKIAQLTQQRTKTEWKQEKFRSIIDKMSVFADKYTSYQSSNNLMSSSFFDQAVKTTALGKYADKVSATGRGTNSVQVNRVKQLASAATYRLSGSAVDKQTSGIVTAPSVSTTDSFRLSGERPVSLFSGSMTLTYGGLTSESKLYIEFDQEQVFESPRELVDEINKQLKDQSVSIGGKTYTGQQLLDEVVQAKLDGDGNITFADPKKNNVYISSASKSIQQNLLGVDKLSDETSKQVKSFNAKDVKDLRTTMKNVDYLGTGNMTITLDGVAKSVNLPTAKEIIAQLEKDGKGEVPESLINEIKNGWEPSTSIDRQRRDDAFVAVLQSKIDSAFGKGKFTVEDAAKDDGVGDAKKSGLQLKFSAAQGSSFKVESNRATALGFGDSKCATSYLNVDKSLGDLLGADMFDPDKEGALSPLVKPRKDEDGNIMLDSNGNPLPEMKNGKPVYMTDDDGNTLYSFKINGVEIGQFSKETKLSTVINAINGTSAAGVKASYSKTTNELLFTARETGEGSSISMDSELSKKLFGSPDTYDTKGTYNKGQDAIFSVSINGTELKDLKRSSNSVEFDGLTLNLKGTFGYETDDNGNMKYYKTLVKDADGKAQFTMKNSSGGDVTIKAEELSDGRLSFYDERTGKTVYGKLDDDLNLSFTHENGKTVYARLTGDGKLTFTEDAAQKGEITAVSESNPKEIVGSEAVTFETVSDSDKIVEAVKAMVEDYNTMIKEIKDAYSSLPLQQNNKQYYEPLTEEEKEQYSESFIEAWEEKAKTGILFGDSDLRSLYDRLTSAISMTGEHGAALRAAGITVNYTDGLSTLEFNEKEFRDALEKDPDKVRDAFVSNTENGAKSNGLMQSLKKPLDQYARTTGGKGVLVNKAGSLLAPTTLYNNVLQTELNNIDTQIDKWTDKMNDQVDYYTSQFSRLEQLIQQMNSQSSYFAQLMTGG
ncbi:flagellar filament capping protein FliD [Oscillospiraceae bacterium 38-13]